jgi:hypothetical protein
MDFLPDFDLFHQILVLPDHITIVCCSTFASIQITIHIEINLPRSISYLHFTILLLLAYFIFTYLFHWVPRFS